MIRRSRRTVIPYLCASLALLAACSDSAAPAPSNPGDPALEPVASGFSMPLFLTAPAGDSNRLFVVEQSGKIRIIKSGAILAAPFLDLTGQISCCGERGLLGLAFHPDYAANGYFFVSYTNPAGDTRIVRYHVSADPDIADSASHNPVLSQTQPFANHNGGMIAFGPDGYLYIALGDGGSGGDPQGNGQNRTTFLGKILRIDVNGTAPYTIPAGNPFVSLSSARGEIWSYGLRNPWRFSFDRSTHEMYIGDVGQNAWEEVDVEPAGGGGRNYGWNDMEGTHCYTIGCTGTGQTLPVLEYDHSNGCSVTGGYVYRGALVPAAVGLYFYSDYCGGWVRSFRWTGSQATEKRDWPALAPGGNVSSFGEDGLGEMYVLSYSNGAVFRFIAAPPAP